MSFSPAKLGLPQIPNAMFRQLRSKIMPKGDQSSVRESYVGRAINAYLDKRNKLIKFIVPIADNFIHTEVVFFENTFGLIKGMTGV